MSILIENGRVNGKKANLYIEGNEISEIGGPHVEADYVIDGSQMAALPGLVNTHTHAAMTLLRGYADDMELKTWLERHIWPVEAKLTEEHVFWGTKLACLEMIKSGTTCFNDMYWHLEGAYKAAEESGLRAFLSSVFIDMFDQDCAKKQRLDVEKSLKKHGTGSRVRLALGPHAVYTVSEESLVWAREFSEKHNLPIHFHLGETRQEVDDCVKKHGKRPVEYLEEMGFLCENLIAAHCVWLTKKEMNLLAKNKVKVSHCPVSNMKLASGTMDYKALREAGITVSLGTDGCASNNNLDMFESMKAAALAQKVAYMDPTRLTAGQAFEMATSEGAKTLGLQCGLIREGALADIALVNLKRPELTPSHNLVSDIVYSANGGCVDTVICDGRILMENGMVEGEMEIVDNARQAARQLVSE